MTDSLTEKLCKNNEQKKSCLLTSICLTKFYYFSLTLFIALFSLTLLALKSLKEKIDPNLIREQISI